jgi:hypothetical protein
LGAEFTKVYANHHVRRRRVATAAR